MAILNLLQLIESDSQETFTSKCNFNFDQILNMGGGPPGLQGFQGIQGVPGGQGLQGFKGDQGTPGSKWYVQNTDPISFGTIIPTPAEGDFWFDTSTLNVYEFVGSPPAWVIVSSLLVSGIFKNSTSDPDRIVFSTPTPLKSLVLSPIDYGAGAPQSGPYKLKLIGSPGGPVMNFGVVESGAESAAAKQAYILLNTVTVGSEYSWELVNPTGDISFSAFGTSLDIIKQISGTSRYEFNSNDFKIQLNATERLMSFFSSPAGLTWHVGGHNALTDTSVRMLSVHDTGAVAIGDAFNNAVTGDTPFEYKFDQLHAQLGINDGDTNKWARWRSKVTNTNYDQISMRSVRSFYEASIIDPWRSSEVRIEHKMDTDFNHFIAFGGGATAPTTTQGLSTFDNIARPALRMGYVGAGATNNDGYYFAADNGPAVAGPAIGLPRIFIGSPTFIKTKTGNLFGAVNAAKLNIEGYNAGATASGLNSHTAIHLNQGIGAGDGGVVGITAGHYQDADSTYAGIYFTGRTNQKATSITLAPGDIQTAGARPAFTVFPFGESYFWSRSNGNAFLAVKAGGTWVPGSSTFYPNDMFELRAYDGTALKSIVALAETNNAGLGDGFFGIGDGFAEPRTNFLITGQWYKGIIGSNTVHNGIARPDMVPFQAVNANLTSGGPVVNAKPVTKFQAVGAYTFGTRREINSYATEVGLHSFTVGQYQQATALRSVVIGGFGHINQGADAVVIGYNGTIGTIVQAPNTITLATTTSLSKNRFHRWDKAYTIVGSPSTSNLLSLSYAGAVGPNGIDIEQTVVMPEPTTMTGLVTGAPATRGIPINVYNTNNNPLIIGPVYTFTTSFQVNGRGNVSIGDNPYEVPAGINGASVDATSNIYAGDRFTTGSYAGWDSIPVSVWWGGLGGAETFSSAAISIRSSTGAIVFEPRAVATVRDNAVYPRISLGNKTVNAAAETLAMLGITGGILHNKTTGVLAGHNRAAGISLIGGELFAPGITNIGSTFEFWGGDVWVAGGRSRYNNGASDGYHGNVVIGMDPQNQPSVPLAFNVPSQRRGYIGVGQYPDYKGGVLQIRTTRPNDTVLDFHVSGNANHQYAITINSENTFNSGSIYNLQIGMTDAGYTSGLSGGGTYPGLWKFRSGGLAMPMVFNFTGTNKMIIFPSGSVYSAGGFSTSAGIDYAEYFESAGESIPVGSTVVMDEDGKIRKATEGDDQSDVFGVVRPRDSSAFVAGNDGEAWAGKYLYDEYGAPIMEDYFQAYEDPNGKRIEQAFTYEPKGYKYAKAQRPKQNPNYDPNRAFVSRADRQEWHIIGMVGQVGINNGEPVNKNWRRMRMVSERVTMWLIR